MATDDRKEKNDSEQVNESTWKIFQDFIGDTSIHGLKYFGEQHRHWVERVFWIIVFTISFILCTIVISKTYDKWQNSPVIVSFDEKMTSIWKIPFPAVTICPETKTKVDIFNITESYLKLKDLGFEFDKLSTEETKSFEALAQVCNGFVPSLFDNITYTSHLERSDIVSQLMRIALPLDEFSDGCYFKGDIYEPCDKIFTKTITELGVCATFNMLNFNEIFNDDV